MATNETVILNNYSDDSQIKQYIYNVLAPRVFHDIPLNVLNTGQFSLINEYMSQTIENLAFTASFYENESFITKAVLADSIYSEAAIFNIGYSFATASTCNMLLELSIADIQKNAKYNPDNGLYEFILDKNTKFNLKNGSVYSLDYDVLIQYQTIETSTITSTPTPAWNIQYINMNEKNICAVNKNPYILYRVSETWLCLFLKVSEYERETHTFVNNMTNGIPNADQTITCVNHIAGFDVKYVDGNGNETYLSRDHILPIHTDVKDQEPYIHYIMDDPHTIRFMFQLNGNRYFVPALNSSFVVTVYTCHGEAANFTAFKADEQPSVITTSNRYSNNGNVTKAAFVMSGSMNGTNIGTIETVRRETIQAYNTANVISSDHDIEEYFKTFFFKNILYPFFFKRRDDPWGRIWSGFFALKDTDDTIFRTNTLHAKIPYRVLYNNNDNIISNNEIIIPPGWAWIYQNPSANRYTVSPLIMNDGYQVETAKSAINVNSDFVFANPFGIRIQKAPFAIGYFNPWVNTSATASIVPQSNIYQEGDRDDISIIYHATPTSIIIKRTYQEDFYRLSMLVSPTTVSELDGSNFVTYFRSKIAPPTFPEAMWNYFIKPVDLYSERIPVLVIQPDDQYIVFNPEHTFFCVRNKYQTSDNRWVLSDIWIEDNSSIEQKVVSLPITGMNGFYGTDDIWGDNGLWKGYEVMVSGNTDIDIYPTLGPQDSIEFTRVTSQNYYRLTLKDPIDVGKRVVSITTGDVFETSLTKFGETMLYRIGQSYAPSIFINVLFEDGTTQQYQIQNAANVYSPYTPIDNGDGTYTFELIEVNPGGVLLYADMKPTASEAAISYYRIPLSLIQKDVALFYMMNAKLPLEKNDLRVVLTASLNGVQTGMIEMQPVQIESDGSILYDTLMYPLNKLVDVDNRIQIASLDHGGGSWIPATPGGSVSVDASTPEFQVKLLYRSQDTTRPSDIQGNNDYIGFRLTDTWNLNDISLVQELKEMRSVTHFGEYQEPSQDQIQAYDDLMKLSEYNPDEANLYTIEQYAYHILNGTTDLSDTTFDEIKDCASLMQAMLYSIIGTYQDNPEIPTIDDGLINDLISTLSVLSNTQYQSDVDWTTVWEQTKAYPTYVDEIFANTSVNSSVEIQLVPFVESALMTSERFDSFVSSFTQVHKAIEPVIFSRLEGNNYLDCKLIATYGLPHSYVADIDKDLPIKKFWPDLNVQIQFDVKLFNPALETNTLNELRGIVRSYFNRLTNVHTPVDMVSMDNNIYISQLIQLLEEHPNVAYLKYRGFYTNEKDIKNGKYMNAEYQGIVQAWDTLDSMPMDELERFVPEMFVLTDDNIVLNIL